MGSPKRPKKKQNQTNHNSNSVNQEALINQSRLASELEVKEELGWGRRTLLRRP